MGNNLVGAGVVAAIADSYRTSAAEPVFEERLMAAVETGRDGSGEETGHRTVLRIEMAKPTPDEGGDAVDDLRRVFDAFKSLTPYYPEWPGDPAMGDRQT